MKKNITIIIISFAIFFLSQPVLAVDSSWALRQEGSQVSAQGECSGDKVKIEFFGKENDKNSAYVSSADCQEGKFSYTADFSKSDLAEGNYIIAINGEKSQNVVAVTKQKEVLSKTAVETGQAQPAAAAADNPETKFLGALVTLQQSILDMQTWLAKTSYPTVVKDSIGMALDGVDFAANKVSDLFVSAENGSMDKSTGASDAAGTSATTVTNGTSVSSSGSSTTILPEKSSLDGTGNAAMVGTTNGTTDSAADSITAKPDNSLPDSKTEQSVNSNLNAAGSTTTIDVSNKGLTVSGGTGATQ